MNKRSSNSQKDYGERPVSASEGEGAGSVDLTDRDDRRVFELLDQAFLSWTNVVSSDTASCRWPRNRRQARKSRALIERAKGIGTNNRILSGRIGALEAVLDSIPPIPWRSLVAPLLLALIPFVFLAGQKMRSDRVERWIHQAQSSTWVLAEDTPLHRTSFLPDSPEDEPLRIVRQGTTLHPLARVGGRTVQVRLENDEIGWVDLLAITEGRELRSDSEIEFYKVDPYVTRSPNVMSRMKRDIPEDQIRLLPPGSTATAISVLPSSTGYEVRLPDGERGFVLHGGRGMLPAVLGEVPIRRHQHFRAYTLEKLQELTRGKSRADVIEALGFPLYFVLDDVSRGIGRMGYGSKLLAVADAIRHDSIVFKLEDQLVVDEELGDPRSVWTERLPLAGRLRRHVDLNGTSLQEWEYEAPTHQGWYARLKARSWLAALPLSLAEIALTIGLLLFFPLLITVPIRFPLAFVTPLPRTVVSSLATLVLLAATYAYFLILVLFIMPSADGVTAALLTLPLLGVFIVMMKRSGLTILYHRCPNCGQMYSAVGQGTDYQHSRVSMDWRVRGLLEERHGEDIPDNVQLMTHYGSAHQDSVFTMHVFLDHRECVFCKHEWSIRRTETSKTSLSSMIRRV